MDAERFEEIFDETDSNLKSLGGADNCWLGLLIIAKYMNPAKHTIVCGAEHDKIWSVDISELCDAGITEEDVVLLAQYNWCEEDGSLMCFV